MSLFEGNSLLQLIDRLTGAFVRRTELLLPVVSSLTVYPCSGALDLSTTLTDVTGMTTGAFTPKVNETARVQIVMYFNDGAGTAVTNAGDVLVGFLNVNTVDEAARAAHVAAGNAGLFCAVCWYSIALTAGTPYTLKVRSRNATGARGRVSTDSHMVVWRVNR